MSTLPTLRALLIDELRGLYFVENHLIKAIPKLAQASEDAELKAAFEAHLKETRGHAARLQKAMKLLGAPIRAKTCHAILGLIKEGGEAVETKGPGAVRDANIIGAGRRVEHFEIAGYGTARSFAQALGYTKVADLLQATLNEEGAANDKLTTISATVNQVALGFAEVGFVTAA